MVFLGEGVHLVFFFVPFFFRLFLLEGVVVICFSFWGHLIFFAREGRGEESLVFFHHFFFGHQFFLVGPQLFFGEGEGSFVFPSVYGSFVSFFFGRGGRGGGGGRYVGFFHESVGFEKVFTSLFSLYFLIFFVLRFSVFCKN